MPKAPENLRDFEALLKVVEHLRGPDGCPWDKEQTHETLTRFAIEEAHELAEAIDSGNQDAIKDELGDLLLQVILNSEIARQEGRFDIYDVIENLNQKMVRRHPHVFGDVKVSGSSQVLENWAQIKAKEKGGLKKEGFGIPKGLPSLLHAHKIGEKTQKLAFDWETVAQVWDKVNEEHEELAAEIKSGDLKRQEEELGDLLFSLVHLARHMGMDSEQILRKTNRRFEERFFRMQDLVAKAGQTWKDLGANEKEIFWKKAKR
jgi:tetrapyrrole methylase family protein/MazG family protein